ncbi:MAG: right-handed parallel beta-helix repeat-containing protein [Actinomycetota bacterium]|nr:right-handed parallel beta-helix repeat-containing protein [Actinomycetota bacterium]
MVKLARAAVSFVLIAILWGAADAATVAAAGGIAKRQASASRVFYVDPVRGDDAASGRSVRRPLRSLSKVARLALRPGDRVRLRAGVVHPGTLTAWQSGTARQPIIVDSYGTGARPVVQATNCVQVSGDHWRITSILARNCSFAGFHVRGDNVELRRIEASGNVAGVAIEPGSANAVVRSSHLHDNNRMAPDTPGPDDDYGSNGVVVSGTGAAVVDNLIAGHRAPSADYGHDGAAIEVYGATGTRVHRNVARDNLTFIELGHSSTTGTRVNYNSVTSVHPSASFVITRGASTFGPVHDTVATHNSVRLTGAGSKGISCHPNCTAEILQIGSNVIQAPDVGYAEAPDGSLAAISLGYNVYDELLDDGWFGLLRAPTDVNASVPFVLTDADLLLRATSPAVDIGGPSWSTDIRYAPAPADGNGDGRAEADAGAFERQPTDR